MASCLILSVFALTSAARSTELLPNEEEGDSFTGDTNNATQPSRLNNVLVPFSDAVVTMLEASSSVITIYAGGTAHLFAARHRSSNNRSPSTQYDHHRLQLAINGKVVRHVHALGMRTSASMAIVSAGGQLHVIPTQSIAQFVRPTSILEQNRVVSVGTHHDGDDNDDDVVALNEEEGLIDFVVPEDTAMAHNINPFFLVAEDRDYTGEGIVIYSSQGKYGLRSVDAFLLQQRCPSSVPPTPAPWLKTASQLGKGNGDLLSFLPCIPWTVFRWATEWSIRRQQVKIPPSPAMEEYGDTKSQKMRRILAVSADKKKMEHSGAFFMLYDIDKGKEIRGITVDMGFVSQKARPGSAKMTMSGVRGDVAVWLFQSCCLYAGEDRVETRPTMVFRVPRKTPAASAKLSLQDVKDGAHSPRFARMLRRLFLGPLPVAFDTEAERVPGFEGTRAAFEQLLSHEHVAVFNFLPEDAATTARLQAPKESKCAVLSRSRTNEVRLWVGDVNWSFAYVPCLSPDSDYCAPIPPGEKQIVESRDVEEDEVEDVCDYKPHVVFTPRQLLFYAPSASDLDAFRLDLVQRFW